MVKDAASPYEAGRRGSAWRKVKPVHTLDLVVLGHTHLPRLTEVEPGRWYVNAGDWVVHHTYLVLEEGEPPRLAEWEVSAAEDGPVGSRP